MSQRMKKAALAGGIVWAAAMFLTTLVSVYTNGYGKAFLDAMASIYPGYSVSVGGSIIGLVYGFFDVFIGVYIFAWVYKRVGK